MTDGKKALEELIAGVGGDMFLSGTTKVSADTIRTIATYVATLEARATAAEERAERLHDALRKLHDAFLGVSIEVQGEAMRTARLELIGDKP